MFKVNVSPSFLYNPLTLLPAERKKTEIRGQKNRKNLMIIMDQK